MKIKRANVLLRFVLLLLLTPSIATVSAQSTINKITDNSIDANCHGYLEGLPTEYASNPTKRYPAIIFFMGLNSTGSGSQTDLEKMFGTGGGYIQDQIRAGSWPASYTVNGVEYKFIVIVPQFITDLNTRQPTPLEVNNVLNYMTAKYRIDTSRIYLTGNSAGGGPTWDYPASSAVFARRIAAIVPFGSVVFPSHEKAITLKSNNVAVWAFHNDEDGSVPPFFTTDFIRLYNQDPLPSTAAQLTSPHSTAHDCWYNPYNRIDPASPQSIYEWMLGKSKTPPKAYAGEDVFINQANVSSTPSTTLTATGTGPNGTASSYQWTKIFAPTTGGGNVASPNSQSTSISALTMGYYRYRVVITDNSGGTSTDEVSVNVFPPIYQGETPASTTGSPTVDTYTEQNYPSPSGSSLYFTKSGAQQSATYNVTVPTTGAYTLRVRGSSDQYTGYYPTSGGTFNITSDGSQIATAFIPWAGFRNNLLIRTPVVNLSAGSHTFGFTLQANSSVNLDYFQLIPVSVAGAALPVKFAAFNVNCTDGASVITWKTASELNAKEFQVERSSNGTDFTTIVKVAARGSASTEQSYSYSDANGAANSVYRVTAVDIDGRKTQTALLKSACGLTGRFTVYPNPVIDKATLEILLEKPARIRISVLDSRGATVQQQSNEAGRGNNQVSLYMNTLPKGTYTINAQWDNQTRSITVIKK